MLHERCKRLENIFIKSNDIKIRLWLNCYAFGRDFVVRAVLFNRQDATLVTFKDAGLEVISADGLSIRLRKKSCSISDIEKGFSPIWKGIKNVLQPQCDDSLFARCF
jgi:hypothetical protein